MPLRLGLIGSASLLLGLAGGCGGHVDKNPNDSAPGGGTGGTLAANGTAGKGSKPGTAGAGAAGGSSSGGARPNSGEACKPQSEEAPGEVVSNAMEFGAGECAGVSLSQVLGAVHAQRPDLDDIVTLFRPDAAFLGDGSFIYAFQRPDGGFAIAMRRGGGDCPAGCTVNDYWYFETSAGCELVEVGEAHRGSEPCMAPDELPRWGVPNAAMPSEICDADLTAQDVTGCYSVMTCGVVEGSCLVDKTLGEPRLLPASLHFVIRQDPGNLSQGSITFGGIGDPLLDGKPFEATFERRKVTVLAYSPDVPSTCQESFSLDFSYDFEGLGNPHLSFNSVQTPNCEGEPDNYCKAQILGTFGEATRSATCPL